MRRFSWLVLVAALTACSSTQVDSAAQAKFDQAVADSDGIAVTAAASQFSCASGELTITGESRLEAPEIGELYVIITTGCADGSTIGPETAEVIHWSLGAWDSVATIGMSKVSWNVSGDCTTDTNTVSCPVKLEPNPTRPDAGTLTVVRSDQSFTAEIVYAS
jgi:hypothetical protein